MQSSVYMPACFSQIYHVELNRTCLGSKPFTWENFGGSDFPAELQRCLIFFQAIRLGCAEIQAFPCTGSASGMSLRWAALCASAASRAIRSRVHRREPAWAMGPGLEPNQSVTVRRSNFMHISRVLLDIWHTWGVNPTYIASRSSVWISAKITESWSNQFLDFQADKRRMSVCCLYLDKAITYYGITCGNLMIKAIQRVVAKFIWNLYSPLATESQRATGRMSSKCFYFFRQKQRMLVLLLLVGCSRCSVYKPRSHCWFEALVPGQAFCRYFNIYWLGQWVEKWISALRCGSNCKLCCGQLISLQLLSSPQTLLILQICLAKLRWEVGFTQ